MPNSFPLAMFASQQGRDNQIENWRAEKKKKKKSAPTFLDNKCMCWQKLNKSQYKIKIRIPSNWLVK